PSSPSSREITRASAVVGSTCTTCTRATRRCDLTSGLSPLVSGRRNTRASWYRSKICPTVTPWLPPLLSLTESPLTSSRRASRGSCSARAVGPASRHSAVTSGANGLTRSNTDIPLHPQLGQEPALPLEAQPEHVV